MKLPPSELVFRSSFFFVVVAGAGAFFAFAMFCRPFSIRCV
jgi:hypothetical protein